MNAEDSIPQADVDVVIPLFNGVAFVAEAIGSVLRGSVLPRRIVVVDDGSTDNGGEVVRALAQQHPEVKIQCFRQQNAGPNAARQHGLKQGDARYVAFLDADDRWAPNKLAQQLALLERSNIALVYCGYHEIDAHGADRTEAKVVAPVLRGNVFRQLLLENRISGSSSAVLIRRCVLDEVGPFDTDLHGSEDWDMWLRIAEKHCIDAVPQDLVAIRRHGSSAQADTWNMLRNMLAFQRKWMPKARHFPEVMHHWGHLIAEFTRRSGRADEAIRMVHATFTGQERLRLFRKSFGSLRLYLVLKRLSALLRGAA